MILTFSALNPSCSWPVIQISGTNLIQVLIYHIHFSVWITPIWKLERVEQWTICSTSAAANAIHKLHVYITEFILWVQYRVDSFPTRCFGSDFLLFQTTECCFLKHNDWFVRSPIQNVLHLILEPHNAQAIPDFWIII